MSQCKIHLQILCFTQTKMPDFTLVHTIYKSVFYSVHFTVPTEMMAYKTFYKTTDTIQTQVIPCNIAIPTLTVLS